MASEDENPPSPADRPARRRLAGLPIDDKLGLDRIIFFSDAVFAIAITLLALEIQLPEIPGEAGFELARNEFIARLPEQLLALWPKYLSYVIGFATIGGIWISHHLKFRYIKRYNRGLIALNLLGLLFAAFLPFPTSILGDFGDTTTAVVFFALTVIPTGLSFAWLWTHAVSHQLIDPATRPATIRRNTLRSLVMPAAFALSLPLAFISPYLAEGLWVASFLVLLTV